MTNGRRTTSKDYLFNFTYTQEWCKHNTAKKASSLTILKRASILGVVVLREPVASVVGRKSVAVWAVKHPNQTTQRRWRRRTSDAMRNASGKKPRSKLYRDQNGSRQRPKNGHQLIGLMLAINKRSKLRAIRRQRRQQKLLRKPPITKTTEGRVWRVCSP